MIDFSLRDDERLLEESARRFGDERLRPGERRHEAEHAYPGELRAAYGELGLGAICVPEDAGGAGLELALAARAWERLAAADPAAPIGLGIPGLASLARSQMGLALARARQPGAAIVVEHPLDLRRRIEAAWVPCHRPSWLAIVSPFGVALATELTITPARACGLAACGTTRVTAESCDPIGDAAEAAGWLVELRVLAAACMLGAARDAAAYARHYAKDRVAFGRPIAHHQGLAFELVDVATELDAAGLLLEAAAASQAPAEVAAAHALVTEVAQRAAERSVQALGGHGYLHDHPVEKRMRDIRALASLYGGAPASERDALELVLEGKLRR